MFGLIATLQVFVKNRTGFLAVRCMLGFAEAGYIPGGAYTLSNWYTKRQLARRVAIFFFGMFGGNAISPLLASGILKLDGAHGLRGWQYIFLSAFLKLLDAYIQLRACSLSACRSSSSYSSPAPLNTRGRSSRQALSGSRRPRRRPCGTDLQRTARSGTERRG